MTCQLRFGLHDILVRLCYCRGIHNNPEGCRSGGRQLGKSHLHVYEEGLKDACAQEIPSSRFKDLQDAHKRVEDFLRYCQIETGFHMSRRMI